MMKQQSRDNSPLADDYRSLKSIQYANRTLNQKSSIMLASTTSTARMDRELSPKRVFEKRKRSSEVQEGEVPAEQYKLPDNLANTE